MPIHVEPDSTWCWFICAGNMVISFCTVGIYRCFGVFYPAVMAEFNVNYAEMSLVTGLFTGCTSFGAFFLAFVKRFGCRKLGMISSFGFSLSLLAAALSNSSTMFIIFCGAMAGFFCGIAFNLSLLTCALYFVKHQSKAAGLASSGLSAGVLAAAPALASLIEYYNWRGAMLIASAISFHGFASAALYRPIKIEVDNPRIELENMVEGQAVSTRQKSMQENRKATKWKKRLRCLFDYRLFSKPLYLLTYLSSIVFWPAMVGCVFLLVPFGMEKIGLSETEASVLLTVFCAGELIGKLLSGFLGDFKRIDRLVMMIITTFLGSLTFYGITFCETLLSTYVLVFLQGLMMAPYMGLYIALYNDVFGRERITRAMSYEGFLSTILTMPATYLLGVLIDITQDVKVSYYLCAGWMLICPISIFGVYCLRKSTSFNSIQVDT